MARTEAPPRTSTAAEPPALEAPAAASLPADTPMEPPVEAARWVDLVARMKSLGVARFWVEGAPDGAITFRCAVPLVGLTAVAQQFEAQGPDVAAAAEAALKRVALWRATESTD